MIRQAEADFFLAFASSHFLLPLVDSFCCAPSHSSSVSNLLNTLIMMAFLQSSFALGAGKLLSKKAATVVAAFEVAGHTLLLVLLLSVQYSVGGGGGVICTVWWCCWCSD